MDEGMGRRRRGWPVRFSGDIHGHCVQVEEDSGCPGGLEQQPFRAWRALLGETVRRRGGRFRHRRRRAALAMLAADSSRPTQIARKTSSTRRISRRPSCLLSRPADSVDTASELSTT